MILEERLWVTLNYFHVPSPILRSHRDHGEHFVLGMV